MNSIYEVVLKILNRYCSGSLNPDDDLFENGLNSFNAVNVLVELEKYFKIAFNDEELDLSKVRTAKNLTAFVQHKMEE